MSTLGQDTFIRGNVASGLGTATDTQVWTHDSGSAGSNVTSDEGIVTGGSTAGNTFMLGVTTSARQNVSVRGTYSGSSDQLGVMGRRTAANTYYRAGLRAGQFEIRLNNAGVVSLLAGAGTTTLSPGPFTFVAGTIYRIRFDLNGTTLQAKVWPDGNSEPAGYQLSVTNAVITAAGGFGLFALVNPVGDSVTFDTFLATDGASSSPVLATAPTSLNFTDGVGGPGPAAQNATLSETAGIGTNWTSNITYGGTPGWLAISPTSGTLAANGTAPITFTCTTGALTLGSYSATVIFTATTGGAIAVVSVNFSITPPAGTAPTYSLAIGGNIANVYATSLLAKSMIGRRGELSATVYDPLGATHYQQYQQCALSDQNASLVWSGYLTSPVETKPGFQAMLLTTFTATDQHYLADKRVVAAVYRNQTCGFIVQDMITNILSAEGVTVGQIAAGPVVPVANFGYVTVAAALDTLVQAASASGVAYYWSIDQNKALWFVAYNAVTGPAVDATQIDDGRLSGLIPSVTRANPLYRNIQYAVGGTQQTSLQTEVHVGDGNTRSFTMGFALAAAPTIATDLNGAGFVAQTVGLKGQTGYQWYWAQGDPIITQDSGGTILRGPSAPIDLLEVIYTGQVPAVFEGNNAAAIAAQATLDGTSGKIEAVINDSTITSAAAGQARVNQLITQYCQNGQLFVFATRASGYQAGMVITVTYAPLGFSGAQMLISEVDASDQRDGLSLWFTVSGVIGPYDVTWAEFFGALLQGPAFAANITLGITLPSPLYPQATTLFPQASTLFPG